MPRTTPYPTTTTVPASSRPEIEDLTWVSATRGWALVHTARCGSACSEVMETTDGGATWGPVGWIDAASGPCRADCGDGGGPAVTRIRFANDLDGYAYDPSLFVTSDGGETWTEENGPSVAALEPAGSTVMRIAYTQSGCPGPCDLTVEEAPAGGTNWNVLSRPFQGDAVQLVRRGVDDAYVVAFENPAGGADDEHAKLMLSHDGGASWSARADPCGDVGGDEYDAAAIAAASPSVLAVLCRDRVGSQASYVDLSTDGGGDFTARPALPGPDTAAALAAISATDLLVGTVGGMNPQSGRFALFSSNDGGAHWQQVAAETGPIDPDNPAQPFLGFETASVGRWIGDPSDLWETTDGGNTWFRQTIGLAP
ncbi:MAG TPA: hypothetical protein VGL48_15935 [Acidimicrobiales bacterium]